MWTGKECVYCQTTLTLHFYLRCCSVPVGGLGGGDLLDSPLPHEGVTKVTHEGQRKF